MIRILLGSNFLFIQGSLFWVLAILKHVLKLDIVQHKDFPKLKSVFVSLVLCLGQTACYHFPRCGLHGGFSDAARLLLMKILCQAEASFLGRAFLAPYFSLLFKSRACFLQPMPGGPEECSRQPCEVSPLQPRGRVSTERVKFYTKEPGKSQNILIGIFHLVFCSQLLLVC